MFNKAGVIFHLAFLLFVDQVYFAQSPISCSSGLLSYYIRMSLVIFKFLLHVHNVVANNDGTQTKGI